MPRVRVVLVLLLLAVTSCTARGEGRTAPTSEPPASAPPGAPRVHLILRPAAGSGRCCVTVTVNPGDDAITVHCNLAAFDPAGRVIYTGIFPPPFPGHRRSIGFSARPGRDRHGLFEVPIDLARDTYEATCREALWHGAPAI